MPSAATGDTRELHLAVIKSITNEAGGARQTTNMVWEAMEGKRQVVLEEQKDKTMRTYTEISRIPH